MTLPITQRMRALMLLAPWLATYTYACPHMIPHLAVVSVSHIVRTSVPGIRTPALPPPNTQVTPVVQAPLEPSHLARKDDDAAVLLFGQIAERYPNLAGQALAAQAQFLDRVLEPLAARDAYRRSLELRPDAATYVKLGKLLMRIDMPEEALRAYSEGLAFDPDDVELRYVHGRALRIGGDVEAAKAEHEALVRDHPDHAPAWTSLARARASLGDEEAVAHLFAYSLECNFSGTKCDLSLASQVQQGHLDPLMPAALHLGAALDDSARRAEGKWYVLCDAAKAAATSISS